MQTTTETKAKNVIAKIETKDAIKNEVEKLTDFILYTQRTFLLSLTSELKKQKVSFSQFFLLGYLAKEKNLTMSDIAHKIGHSTAAITTMGDKLEKHGYVQRIHDANDRRKVRIQLTSKAFELIDNIRENITSKLWYVIDKLDERQQQLLVNNFSPFTEALK